MAPLRCAVGCALYPPRRPQALACRIASVAVDFAGCRAARYVRSAMLIARSAAPKAAKVAKLAVLV